MAEQVVAHVAEKMEAGAILTSSWGYDQTNVDFYMVTRVTEKSAWIVPMKHVETPEAGYSPMAGFAMPVEPMFERQVYDRTDQANPVLVSVPIAPERHKIHHYSGHESLSLTSYSNASLWNGSAQYASHDH